MPQLNITSMAEAFFAPEKSNAAPMAPRLSGSISDSIQGGVALQPAPKRLRQHEAINSSQTQRSHEEANVGATQATAESGVEPKSQQSREPRAAITPNRLQIREHLEALGAEPLPEDIQFYQSVLPIRTHAHNALLRALGAVWMAVMALEEVDHKKQNRGRHAANCWLRNILGISK
ncbi:hypothetical protein AWR36_006065 [Microbulbifer flavimaris]|uniref:Uncharacterized protein n=1 Tax=Microbulbifer flavimaris TaxID=1781068 RepID=A0ABX4HZM6_9GAMM|nr:MULTISPECIES: hypothetical protein [Microbulbifer]KUJ83423.1 hypothetical protein AVO43_06050 [Microbulbifer sp. ZGT114]PCO05579.1 hypothetical protein AWR36_006065 [Microbulbifer flavimaris]